MCVRHLNCTERVNKLSHSAIYECRDSKECYILTYMCPHSKECYILTYMCPHSKECYILAYMAFIAIRGKMRNYGGFDFGPGLRKLSMKKERTKLMKKSLKQLKRTRECYMINNLACSSRPSNGMKSSHESIEKPMPLRIVRKNTEKTCSPRPNNGMKSSHENNEKSMSSSSRIVRKNTEMSRPSSLKPNNGVASSRRTAKSCPSPITGMICLWNDTDKSRPSSLRPVNGIDSVNKNTNGGALRLKDIEKPRTCSLRLNNGEASQSKNTEMPRSPSSRPSDNMVSPPTNIKKPNNGLVPLRGNNESYKSRPSRLSNGSSSVLKVDPNSMFGISKESHHSSIFGNSRIAAQMVNGEAQKEDIPMMLETSNLSLKLKGNQDNIRLGHVAKVSRMITNKERHAESMGEHFQVDSRKLNNGLLEYGGIGADKLKRTRMEPLLEENRETHEDDDSEDPENCRPTNRRRRLILNDYEDDDDGDQNLAGVEIGTAGLTTQTGVVKDSSIKASNPFLSESLKLQQYGSLPIDEPVWSGIIKRSSKKNVSLAAHLSTKCCEAVWNLAESLQQEIVVTELSRLEAWPKSFEASRPTDDNIALYFLPCEMRQDADLDQLVKEVVENDMVLQAVIGEAEMLIFPSILLPEQHQTFQGKPYLWAVFRRRKNNVATVEAKQHDKGRCAEDEMGKQQDSHSSVDKEGHNVARLNTHTGPEALEEMEWQGMEQEQNSSLARANTPRPATRDPTMNATTSAHHGQILSSLAVPTGALFGFVVQGNPRIEQLIQEMQREGAVVVAMRGEMIGSGLGQAAASGREEDKTPPSSS
ncbi:hypothetical protein ACQ4PT_016892 [Festuca glaucescens]